MDCNKEEAIRAKEIAEKKMQNSDFVGARKIALKAQKLFPDLENMSQLLTVCEVHCSSQNKLNGSEMDWYGILSVERLADGITVKKQYRKLALSLHPDKNKFAGAEAAFKLIGEAHRILSDQVKRSLYDMKCRVSARTAETKVPPSNKSSFLMKQYAASINARNVTHSQFTQLNPDQQAHVFWTCCSFCGTRFQYNIVFLNKWLCCRSCGNPFTAYDLDSTLRQTLNQHQFQNRRSTNIASQSNDGNPSGSRFGDKFAGLDPVSKTGGAAEVCQGSKTEKKRDGHVDVGDEKEGVALPKSNVAKPRESGTSRNASWKRKRREQVVASRERRETRSSYDSKVHAVIKENGANPVEQNSGFNQSHQSSRSSRQTQHVSCKENLSDDDLVSPPKRSRKSGLPSASEKLKEAAVNGTVSNEDTSACSTVSVDNNEEIKRKAPLEERLQSKKCKPGECKVKQENAAELYHNDEKPNVDNDFQFNANVGQGSNSYVCPDADFSDFEKNKADGCFAVDQIWAIYDSLDSMPRFYAQVRKVYSPGFKLRITWLEPNPDDQGKIDWCNKELPVACGKYKFGVSEDTIDRPMFSHQMHWMKGSHRFSRLMYPRKGETWALFRNWDISWSSVPEKHKPYKFEFVEVLTDFDEDVGIGVAYLAKVKGFVCLFQQGEQHGILAFQIPPDDLYRFSHCVPSFRMTGEEGEGVPKGSFELDPAALPTDIDKFDDSSDVKIENEISDAEVCVLCPESPDHKLKPMMGSKRVHTAKKNHSGAGSSHCTTKGDGGKNLSHENLTQPKGSPSPCRVDERMSKECEKNDHLDREALNLRRSPRDLSKRNSQVETSQCTAQEGTNKSSDINKDEMYRGRFSLSNGTDFSCPSADKMGLPLKSRTFNGGKNISCGNLTQPKGSLSSCQADEKNDLDRETLNLRRSPRDVSNKSSQVETSQRTAQEETGKSSDINKDEVYRGGFSWSKRTDFLCLSADKMDLHLKSRTFSSCKISEAQHYDFNGDRSEDKFQVDQIWALYGFPKKYAQVKKIEYAPYFRLYVAFLESCSSSKEKIQQVCCGTFEVKNREIKVLPRTSFSHRLRVESIGKSRYKIQPRKGEVWAIYRNWNSNLTCSDIENGEYEIVEVLDDNDQNTTVVVLVNVNGYKSVYRAPRSRRSKTSIIDIPRTQLGRFSHQIPAFQLTEEKNSRLRGCWELDCSSIPGLSISLD